MSYESQQQDQRDLWNGHPPPPPPNPWSLERRISLLEQSNRNIEKELSKVNNNLGKLVWIVITAVVLAGINVIFNGSIGG